MARYNSLGFSAKSARAEAVIGMLASGMQQKEVAAHLRISRSVINHIVQSQPGYVSRADRAPGERNTAFNSKMRPTQPVRFAEPKPIPAAFDTSKDHDLIAAYIASRGVKKCPTVALNPTQATLAHNPGLYDGKTSEGDWGRSRRGDAKHRRNGMLGAMRAMPSCRAGSVI